MMCILCQRHYSIERESLCSGCMKKEKKKDKKKVIRDFEYNVRRVGQTHDALILDRRYHGGYVE